MQFHKATKAQQRLKMAINGPAGSGKTFTALTIAQHLGQRIAVIDTENGSSEAYANMFDFDILRMSNNNLRTYIQAIEAAVSNNYDIVIIDSLSHAWNGKGGVLETVDIMNTQTANSGWRNVTPLQNEFIDTILRCPIHLIGTMRVKMKYEYAKNDRGKIEPKKIGLAPVQREGFEYEFDIILDMTQNHAGFITKTRAPSLSGYAVMNPGQDLAILIDDWLNDSEPEPDRNSDTWKKQMRQFHALGKELFGDDWDNARQRNIKKISNGLYDSSKKLKQSHLDRLIEGMKTMKKQRAEEKIEADHVDNADNADDQESTVDELVEAAQIEDEEVFDE